MALKRWKENLPNRVPEYLRDPDAPLYKYLEVCGQMLDEMQATIAEHDTYKDYRNSPESRLNLIAGRFGFESPVAIDEVLMRGIIRDIAHVTKSRGVEDSIMWVFKILNWGATIKTAWLPNPHYYDDRIKEAFPSFYTSEGIDIEELYRGRAFTPKIGEKYDYKVGVKNQRFHLDDDYIFAGDLLVGDNQIVYQPDGRDVWTPAGTDYFIKTNDVSKIDYRNFLYGEASHTPFGNYFNGGRWYETPNDKKSMRILGEWYDGRLAKRTQDIVMATPYIVVEIDRADFDAFTGSYGSGTVSERYDIAKTLLEYVLDEFIRPSNVKVLMIVGRSYLDNKPTIHHVIEDVHTHEPMGFGHGSTISEIDASLVSGDYPMTVGSGMVIGAPSFQPVNSWSCVHYPTIGEMSFNEDYHVNLDGFNYSYSHTFTELDGGVYTSSNITLRTPSKLRLTNVTGSLSLFGSPTIGGQKIFLMAVTEDSIFDVKDVYDLEVRSVTDFSGVNIDIKWLPQNQPIHTGSQKIKTTTEF